MISGSVVPASKNGPLPDSLGIQVTGKGVSGELTGNWQPLPFDARVAAFRGELTVPAGGWYRVVLRARRGDVEVANLVVEHVGVGEVFVIAGQSNSANYGEETQTTRTRLVAAFDGVGWQLANDPQPGAGGTRGSFMPIFGDAMAERFGVPIGIVAMGIGSTSVREWLPPGTRMTRLPTITKNVVTVGPEQWEAAGRIFTNFAGRIKQLGPRGFRAVLWHQGESDARQSDPERTLPGELYRQAMEQLIRETRKEAGWEVPWFVAQVSYHSPTDMSPDLRAAQKALWSSGIALEGPDTDTLLGDMREKGGQGVHMSGKGLREHGRMWADRVAPWLENELSSKHQAPNAR